MFAGQVFLLLAAFFVAKAAGSQVSYFDCGCNGAASNPCPSFSLSDNQCLTSPTISSYTQTKLSCVSTSQMCATFIVFSDAACSQYNQISAPVCGQCSKIGTQSVMVDCDFKLQITQVRSCDEGCKTCSATKSMYALGNCQQSVNFPSIYVVGQGISPCAAVKVQHWNNSGSCQNTPDTERYLSQGMCVNHAQFACANAPALPAMTTANSTTVLTTSCNLECHPNCNYFTSPSGVCQTVPGGYSRMATCQTGTSTCATFAIFDSTNCDQSTFSNTQTVACGSCLRLNQALAKGYTFLQCDATNGMVTLSTECDPQCKSCKKPNAFPRPQYKCKPSAFVASQSWLNYGIHSCNTVKLSTFESTNCDAATLFSSIDVAQGTCDGGARFQCTGSSELNSLTTSPCYCNSSSQCAEMTKTYADGSCVSYNATTSAQMVCSSEQARCADLQYFTDSACTQWFQGFQPVCDTCILSQDHGYSLVTCDESTQTITASTNCDSTCKHCSPAGRTVVAALSACTKSISTGYWVINRGFSTCNTFTRRIFFNSNQCQGIPAVQFLAAQSTCGNGERVICGNRTTFKNPTTPQGTGKVLLTMCQDNFCTKNCTQKVFSNGVCQAQSLFRSPPGSSSSGKLFSTKLTCEPAATCVRLTHFTGSGCDPSTADGQTAAVCNACVFLFSSDTQPTFVYCDRQSQAVYLLRNCSDNCTGCAGMGSFGTQPPATYYGQCQKMHDQQSNSNAQGAQFFINRGIFQCDTVRVEQFADSNCAGTMGQGTGTVVVQNFTFPTGACVNGATAHCGTNFNLPDEVLPSTVNQEHCPWKCNQQDPHCHEIHRYGSQTCQVSESNAAQSFSVSCIAATQMCSRAYFFTDNKCSNFAFISIGVCGSCNANTQGSYYKLTCDPRLQAVTVTEGCDVTCTVCSNPTPIQYFPNTCDATLTPGYWVQNTGIVQCDTLVKMSYLNSSVCQGAPVVQWKQQYKCDSSDRYWCDGAAKLPPAPTTNVLHTVCNDMWCSRDCTATLIVPGECINNGTTSSKRVTCSTESTMCASIAAFTGPTCQGSTFLTIHEVACGVCVEIPHTDSGGPSTYAVVDCNATSQTWVYKGCSDSACTDCSKTTTVAIDQCGTPFSRPGSSGRNMGISPCNTVKVEGFAQPNCQGPARSSFTVADQHCDFGARYQCGDFLPPLKPGVQSYTYTQCCGKANCPTQQNITNGGCVNGLQGQFRSTRATCQPELSTCANLLSVSTNGGHDISGVVSTVCGSCQSLSTYGYAQYECDSRTQAVTINFGCDANCLSCTGSSQVILLDEWAKWPYGTDSYTLNRGLVPCPAIFVSHYAQRDCQGAAVWTQMEPQNQCNTDGLYYCALQPNLIPTPKNESVLVSTCSGGGCSSSCSYESVKSGQCTATGFGSMRATCTGEIGYCATMAIYKEPNCPQSSYAFGYSTKCGACEQLPGDTTFTYVNCNTPGTVIMSTGCDETCVRCTGRDSNPRPRGACVPAIGTTNQWAIMWGVTACNVVNQAFYTQPRCPANALVGSTAVAEGRCNGHNRYRCGVYSIQSVVINSCQENCSLTPHGCGSSTLQSGQCQAWNGTSAQRFTCIATPSQCAHFVVYSANNCKKANYQNMFSVGCNTCIISPALSAPMKIICDPSAQTVTLLKDCDATCSTCNQPPEVHLSRRCSLSPVQNQAIYLQSVAPCDVVSHSIFMQSPTCSGTPWFEVTQPQGTCANGMRAVCGNAPYVSAPALTGSTQVLRTHCSDSRCTKHCKVTVHTDGVCFSNRQDNSSRFSCMSNQLCVAFDLFQTSDCSGSAVDKYTSVCNTCGYFNGTYNRVRCSSASNEAVLDGGCDAQCFNCTNPNLAVRDLNTCVPGLTAGYYVLNRGLFPCSAVKVERYASLDCNPQSIKGAFVAAQGECGMGLNLQCGTYHLPNRSVHGEPNVTTHSCLCGNNCQPPTVIEANTCQAASYGSYSVSCDPRPQLCVSLAYWGDATCSSSFQTIATMSCNACVPDRLGEAYLLVMCSESSQSVSIRTGCDATCTTCSATGRVINYPLSSCVGVASSLPTDAIKFQQNMGVVPCRTVSRLEYANGACQGQPSSAALIAQQSCSGGQMFSCGHGRPPPPSAAAEVLRISCPQTFCGGPQCTSSILKSGQCTSGMTATCGPVGRCAAIITFNDTACNNFRAVGTYACDSCIFSNGLQFSLTCPTPTQVVMNLDCQPGCTACKRSMTINLDTCAAPVSPLTHYASLHNVYPCRTVQVQKYSSPTCAESSLTISYNASNGGCEEGVRYLCGADFSVPTQTPVPAAVTTSAPVNERAAAKHGNSDDAVGIALGVIGGLLVVCIVGALLVKKFCFGGPSREPAREISKSDLEEPMYEREHDGN